MKIAICISGQLRTFADCLPFQDKHLLQPLQPDVFIHTWDKIGVTHKTHQLASPSASAAKAQLPVTPELLQPLYHPKACIVEPFHNAYYDELAGVTVPRQLAEAEPMRYKGALPMSYGMKKSLELMCEAELQNSAPYDIVIRLRPDLTIREPIPAKLLEQPETLWWPLWPDLDPSAQVSDKLAFSSSANMGYYLSLIDHLPKYWENPLGDGSWAETMIGERIMRRHVTRATYPDQPFELNIECLR